MKKLAILGWALAGTALTAKTAISGYRLSREAVRENGVWGVAMGFSVLGGLSVTVVMIATVLRDFE